MNNYYDVFRRKSGSTKCSDRGKANIVMDAVGTTTVFHRRVKKDIEVNLVISNRTEGLGTAKVYTWAKDNLRVGDYFVWRRKHVLLVTDQENNVLLDCKINKFMARECNVIVHYKTEDSDTLDKHFDAVFIGKAQNKINPFLRTREDNPLFALDIKDMIIYSGEDLPRFKSCIIKKQQWDVVSWDDVTACPIIYSTIEQVPLTLLQAELPDEDTDEEIIYRAGLTYEFITENYYFKSDLDLKPERQKDKIILTMPYNLDSITFETKENNEIITNVITIER